MSYRENFQYARTVQARFIEAIESAKAKGVVIVSGRYGLEKHDGRLGYEIADANIISIKDLYLAEPNFKCGCALTCLIIESGAQIPRKYAGASQLTEEAIHKMAARILSISPDDVAEIVNGFDQLESNSEWHRVGNHLAEKFDPLPTT